MITCIRCKRKMFVDRQYTTNEHLETYCIACGNRNFYHPPSQTKEGSWILQQESLRAKYTIASL
jgi:DNA-directed RNA polymerase subunit RPC12/RpoP